MRLGGECLLKKTKISLSVIGNLSDWLNFYHSKVTDDYTSRTTLRRGKFKKINKIVESSLEPGELKIYKILTIALIITFSNLTGLVNAKTFKFESSSYEGESKKGKAHGVGIFTFSDGSKYEGLFS